jgi:hypothetical protein
MTDSVGFNSCQSGAACQNGRSSCPASGFQVELAVVSAKRHCLLLGVFVDLCDFRWSFFSGTGSPGKSPLGKVGVSTQDMKEKGTEIKPAKDKRSDRRYEERFEDHRDRAPTQDK